MNEFPPEMTDEEIDAMLDGAPRNLNFSGKNLNHQAICEESLKGANFRGALLIKADLSGSDLSGAAFDGADLFRADLFRVSCVGASFLGARLDLAAISEADLRGADFSGSSLNQIYFEGSTFDSKNRFDGAFGIPTPPTFIIVDGRRLEGDDANRWLRERIAPKTAEQAA